MGDKRNTQSPGWLRAYDNARRRNLPHETATLFADQWQNEGVSDDKSTDPRAIAFANMALFNTGRGPLSPEEIEVEQMRPAMRPPAPLVLDDPFVNALCALTARYVVSNDGTEVARALLRTASGVLDMLQSEQADIARQCVREALDALHRNTVGTPGD